MRMHKINPNKRMIPFFTIITVCLNAGDELNKTINSILSQDYQDFNIIIKDGFSSDGSFEQITKNEKINKIQKKDNGIYDAMNQALEYSDGQYILFLNAGDYFSDNSVLSSFNIAIIENNFLGLVYCDYTTTDLRMYVQSPLKLTDFFLFRTMLCHQVCMIKREFYESLGYFDTTFRVDADYDFLLRLLIVEKAKYLHIPKLGIISTSKGFSFQNKDIAKKEVEIIRKKYFKERYPIYKAQLAFTLPSLRGKFANHTGMISKLYQRLVNVINRSL